MDISQAAARLHRLKKGGLFWDYRKGGLSARCLVFTGSNLQDLGDSSFKSVRFSLPFQETGDGRRIYPEPFRQSLLSINPVLEHADLDFDPMH